MKIKGRIVKGVGESASFLEIPWVAEQVCEKFAFSAFPGTLNIAIDKAAQRRLRERGCERLVHRQEGFCDALIFKAKINGTIECGVVLPLVESYSPELLEIIAPVHLKDALKVKEGDEVTVDVEIERH